MRYSKLFTKTQKSAPKDELTANAKLLYQAGYVNKLMAGVYSYLPLGLMVLKKIEHIIRHEMNAIGGQEVSLPALHPKEIWQQSGGWEQIDILFKIKSRTNKNYALGQSHEEVITPLVKEHVRSYKDFPLFIYQIQNKYRDELRAKSGILRGKEFGMKDMYSFHLTQIDFDRFYQIAKTAYIKIFRKLNLDAKVTEASGGSFTEKISYEFMVLTPAGEDEIIYCSQCDFCINLVIAKNKTGDLCPRCQKEKLKKGKASEVGNVFDLGQKYSKAFNFFVTGQKGERIHPIMGCYGIGTTRLMGVLVEKFHDDKGICWPINVAPFLVHLVNLQNLKKGEKFYQRLLNAGVKVLLDDRKDLSAGEQFKDADLLGMPIRLLVSEKTKDLIEWKERTKEKIELLTEEEVINRLLSFK